MLGDGKTERTIGRDIGGHHGANSLVARDNLVTSAPFLDPFLLTEPAPQRFQMHGSTWVGGQ